MADFTVPVLQLDITQTSPRPNQQLDSSVVESARLGVSGRGLFEECRAGPIFEDHDGVRQIGDVLPLQADEAVERGLDLDIPGNIQHSAASPERIVPGGESITR